MKTGFNYFKFYYTWIHEGNMGVTSGFFTNQDVLLGKLECWNRIGKHSGWIYMLSPENIRQNENPEPVNKLPLFKLAWYGEAEHNCERNNGDNILAELKQLI